MQGTQNKSVATVCITSIFISNPRRNFQNPQHNTILLCPSWIRPFGLFQFGITSEKVIGPLQGPSTQDNTARKWTYIHVLNRMQTND
jgi:hypothetical protein